MRHERISIDPDVLVGKPVIRGTRISVELILAHLGRGWTVESILKSYPRLVVEDIQAAQTFASDYLAEHYSVAAE